MFVKLQGPILEKLWLNRATLGKYVVNNNNKIILNIALLCLAYNGKSSGESNKCFF